MTRKKVAIISLFAAVVMVAVPVMVAWITSDTERADAKGVGANLSDKKFAERIAGTYFNYVIGPVGPTLFLWTNHEDGSVILHDSTDEDANDTFLFAYFGVALDLSGPDSPGFGRWERSGRHEYLLVGYEYKYAANGTPAALSVNMVRTQLDDDYNPISSSARVDYYNLVEATKGGETWPPVSVFDVMNPDPTQRPQPILRFDFPTVEIAPGGAGGEVPIDTGDWPDFPE